MDLKALFPRLQALFPPGEAPQLLVGLDSPDDAAVWQLDSDRALVVTADFFPPVVDDATVYGQIAAANALSDVYAMGGKPLLALNLASFPADMPARIAQAILLGGASKVKEAGAVTAGGHTVEEKEPFYGLAVVGLVHPARLLRKQGLMPGDLLYLTKPLGTGVITTAARADKSLPGEIEGAIESMRQLNAAAAEAAIECGITAATDVTGFGLTGHLAEMAEASGCAIRLHWDALPWLPGAKRCAAEWIFPGGARRNALFVSGKLRIDAAISAAEAELLHAPETSGGLVMAAAPGRHAALEAALAARGQAFWQIGECQPRREGEPLLVVS